MYALIENGQVAQYPYTLDQLRGDNPQTIFAAQMTNEMFSEWSVFPVLPTSQPEYDEITQNLIEDTPILIDGNWNQVWEVRSATAQEIAERKQQIKDEITVEVQERLDAFARTRGYDDIVSACSYAVSQHPKYGVEGRYCVEAREDTWDVLFQIEDDVVADIRPMPRSYADIEADLPVLAWPV